MSTLKGNSTSPDPMLGYNDVNQWLHTIPESTQLNMHGAVIDCSTDSDSSYRTPVRPPRMICPPAPKKKRLTLEDYAAGEALCKMRDVGTQTDLSLGTQRVKGLSLHLASIHYGCADCLTLVLGDASETPYCRFCGGVMKRNAGTNVGLYHMVPYFE